MWQKLTHFLNKIIKFPWTAEFIALVGGLVYLYQSYRNALIRTSFLDEGLYLFKGWLFTGGQYTPFADYGPWTNQMPLSYLIPGAAQVIFGPGLRTGRYFAIFLSLLMLVGLWLVTRRLAGSWWATGVVWALALNIASIKIYGLAISEVVVACLFAWTLFFILGEKRSTWQIAIGGLLAAAIVLVRINLAPVVVLVVLYIFWQHGIRKGWIAFFTAAGLFLIMHAIYWPEILKIYAAWFPRSLTPFLDPWRLSGTSEKWVTSAALNDAVERILYFFLSFRLHILSLGGALVVWLLWPGSASKWKSHTQFRTAVFLSVTLVVLLLMHMLAAFTLGFCISCVLLYITFFDFLGLILVAQSYSALKKSLSGWRALLVTAVFFIMGIGLSFSIYGEMQSSWVQFIERQFDYNLNDFFLWSRLQAIGISDFNIYQMRVAMFDGMLLLGLVLLLALLITSLLHRRPGNEYGFSHVLLFLCLGLSLVFSPTVFLSRGNDFFLCGGDVISSYEDTGEVLKSQIPDGSKVFWVGRIPALFLYLPEVEFYPPQLNHFHNFRIGGNDDELVRFGLWNESLGRRWMSEADVVLVEDAWLDGWVQQSVETSGLQELESPPLPESCRPDSLIHIYVRP